MLSASTLPGGRASLGAAGVELAANPLLDALTSAAGRS